MARRIFSSGSASRLSQAGNATMGEEGADLSFGFVKIVKGKYKDAIGYFDDTDGDKAVVYLNKPTLDIVLLPQTILEPASNPQATRWLNKNGHPMLDVIADSVAQRSFATTSTAAKHAAKKAE